MGNGGKHSTSNPIFEQACSVQSIHGCKNGVCARFSFIPPMIDLYIYVVITLECFSLFIGLIAFKFSMSH